MENILSCCVPKKELYEWGRFVMETRNAYVVMETSLAPSTFVALQRIESLCHVLENNPKSFPANNQDELYIRDIHGKIWALFGVVETLGKTDNDLLEDLPEYAPNKLIEALILMCQANIDVSAIVEKLRNIQEEMGKKIKTSFILSI